MDEQQAFAAGLAQQGTWAVVFAVIVGALVWLTKEGTPTSLLVPARYRLPLAAVLGQLTALVSVIAAGVPVKDAVLTGFAATALSWAGHELGVEKLRGGQEVGVKPEETRAELRAILPTDKTPLPAVVEGDSAQASDPSKPE
jgi:hypothetical protein